MWPIKHARVAASSTSTRTEARIKASASLCLRAPAAECCSGHAIRAAQQVLVIGIAHGVGRQIGGGMTDVLSLSSSLFQCITAGRPDQVLGCAEPRTVSAKVFAQQIASAWLCRRDVQYESSLLMFHHCTALQQGRVGGSHAANQRLRRLTTFLERLLFTGSAGL